MNILEQVPDSVKITMATSPTVLTLFGYPIEQWMYVFSLIVSILFVIEKLPKVFKSIKEMYTNVKSYFSK